MSRGIVLLHYLVKVNATDFSLAQLDCDK